jgi:hypothetical protein
MVQILTSYPDSGYFNKTITNKNSVIMPTVLLTRIDGWGVHQSQVLWLEQKGWGVKETENTVVPNVTS